MARMKFLCDAERCIECNACVTACKNENDVPWGVNRRRVVTINDGSPGVRSMSVACMHCSDAPCAAVCPVDCFYTTDDGVVLHDKDICIGCGYCFYACPFGAPQFPSVGAFGSRDYPIITIKSKFHTSCSCVQNILPDDITAFCQITTSNRHFLFYKCIIIIFIHFMNQYFKFINSCNRKGI